ASIATTMDGARIIRSVNDAFPSPLWTATAYSNPKVNLGGRGNCSALRSGPSRVPAVCQYASSGTVDRLGEFRSASEYAPTRVGQSAWVAPRNTREIRHSAWLPEASLTWGLHCEAANGRHDRQNAGRQISNAG